MTAEHFKFPRNTSYRSCTGIRAKRIVPVETNEPKMCLNSAVLSKFSNKFHRVQNLETDGIQEVSGSICLWVYVSNEHCNGTEGGLGKRGLDIK